MGKLLHTENLSVGYSGKPAVTLGSNINIVLRSGQLTALVGANGIGKSTLLRTLSGLQPALSGKVFVGEVDLATQTPLALSQKISIVLTGKLPAGHLTVHELIALGRQPYTGWRGKLSAADLEVIERAIQLTGVQDLLSRPCGQISDGQLQNALIARALAQDTDLILFDEPTTHLDLPHKLRLFRLLQQLARDTGKSLLFSTHDIELALEYSDGMLVMNDGTLSQGTATELIANGTINQLFLREGLAFDAEKKRFHPL